MFLCLAYQCAGDPRNMFIIKLPYEGVRNSVGLPRGGDWHRPLSITVRTERSMALRLALAMVPPALF